MICPFGQRALPQSVHRRRLWKDAGLHRLNLGSREQLLGNEHLATKQPAVSAPRPVPRPAEPVASAQAQRLLWLQRTAGNRAVQEMLGAGPAGEVAHQSSTTTPEMAAAPATAPAPVQRSWLGDLWGDVKGAASAAWGGIKGVASDVWAGAKSLGSGALSWLKSAGSHVWNAIKWFGGKAWTVIKAVGSWGWEKLSLLGTLVWSFLSNLPERLWRLVVDLWDGIAGILGWLWTGLKGLAGGLWDAVVGVFSWIGSGLEGALKWLGKGIADGASWAVDFLQDPSLDKLLHGLLSTLGWVWSGITGFAQWGWNGLVAAAKWAWSGLKGFASWLWDGAIGGLTWVGLVILHLLELAGVPEALELIWGLIFRLRPLTSAEQSASEAIHPRGLIPYWQVRVDDDSYLIKIGTALAKAFKTKVSPGAITTMHVIHAPKGGLPLPTAVHELTHVAQYELVGAVYMPEALHAQGTAAGYNYGNLTTARAAGQHFADFNREQQASICEDYYDVTHGMLADYGATEPELDPFIADMRARKF